MQNLLFVIFFFFFFFFFKHLFLCLRIQCCSLVPCVWIWTPLMATLMRRSGELWNSHISRTLCLACLKNSTMSVQKEERISGINSFSTMIIHYLINIWSDWISGLQFGSAAAGLLGSSSPEEDQDSGFGWSHCSCRPGDRQFDTVHYQNSVWGLHRSDHRTPSQHHHGLH